MRKINQSGFAAIEAVLIVVVIGIIGFTGWFVWNAKQTTDESLANTANSQPGIAKNNKKSSTKTPVKDPTSDWVAYTNAPGKYSLRYPKTWSTALRPELCTDTLLLLGGNATVVGKCASENFGQMGIDSVSGDKRDSIKLGTGYTNVTQKTVTSSGLEGIRQVGIASGQRGADGMGFGYDDGTEVIKYVFFTNDRTYSATYIHNDPDVLNDFDTMITKTLSFNI